MSTEHLLSSSTFTFFRVFKCVSCSMYTILSSPYSVKSMYCYFFSVKFNLISLQML
ncbi:unnamed protein product [Brassica rapa subsp. trilocularis]